MPQKRALQQPPQGKGERRKLCITLAGWRKCPLLHFIYLLADGEAAISFFPAVGYWMASCIAQYIT